MSRRLPILALFFGLVACNAASVAFPRPELFAKDNLVAWCIVPFDAKKRGPEERAAMLEKMGIKRLAYDYRKEHIPTFDAELDALKRHGIELTAWWFPGSLNEEARMTLDLFKRHGVNPQLWITGGGAATKDAAEQSARVESEAARIRPVAEEAAKLGLKVALYNHGNWFGEPENQLAIIERLQRDGVTNVGIVYNQHHGHEHLDRFPVLLEKMKPHLLAVNLNGMFRDGDKLGRKIVPLGQGDLDLQLLRLIRESGWQGPIGLLNHTDEDAEARLLDNLDGLLWLTALLDGKPAGPAPMPRSWKAPAWPAAKPEGALGDVQIIPAANSDELTRANGWPAPESFRRWDRSLGGPTSNRFSALTQIDKKNVAKLEVAWTYRAGDGTGNIQCNPIIVDGVMFAPTPGGHVVAVDASDGQERWRFKVERQGNRLEDAVARRGLLYWPGDAQNADRVIFGSGNWL
ncbi:MAG: TIM barrel protein, partial [Opitutaceae bacterium]